MTSGESCYSSSEVRLACTALWWTLKRRELVYITYYFIRLYIYFIAVIEKQLRYERSQIICHNVHYSVYPMYILIFTGIREAQSSPEASSR